MIRTGTTGLRHGRGLGGARLATASMAILLLGSCDKPAARIPQTEAATQSAFTYVPLDPLPVVAEGGADCTYREGRATSSLKPVLEALPDNAVRVAIRQLDASGSATVGPAKMGAEGHQYQVILDYINADVVNMRFVVTRDIKGKIVGLKRQSDGAAPMNAGEAYEGASAAPGDGPGAAAQPAAPEPEESVIPVYVGVGLRLTANVTVLKGNVNLSSLGALAAEAQANNIRGALIVQTLGITGKQVTTALPLPSELNATTIQNAILALGSIKAMVYDPSTIISPRVTGVYNPLGTSDERIINQIVSGIARWPVRWQQPCKAK